MSSLNIRGHVFLQHAWPCPLSTYQTWNRRGHVLPQDMTSCPPSGSTNVVMSSLKTFRHVLPQHTWSCPPSRHVAMSSIRPQHTWPRSPSRHVVMSSVRPQPTWSCPPLTYVVMSSLKTCRHVLRQASTYVDMLCASVSSLRSVRQCSILGNSSLVFSLPYCQCM